MVNILKGQQEQYGRLPFNADIDQGAVGDSWQTEFRHFGQTYIRNGQYP